jgi:diguanylate cyclase (GGDEF)-like protein/PAS domain S-box-containing protein
MTKAKHSILAIDDTPANLLTLGATLELEFDLQIATSGAMGLMLAAKARPDLILLDIMMPEMDGFETCRRLKANPALKDIPVVFVSALTEIESESTGLALGAVDYITKPINVEIARQRIRNLIERDSLRKDVVAQRDQLESRVLELDLSRHALRQQMRFADALNKLSQVIIQSDTADLVLQETTRIVGETLGLDRALVYTIDLATQQAQGRCEWINPQHPQLHPSIRTYPLDMFRGGLNEIMRSKRYLTSQTDQINPHFVEDGSGQILHQKMHVQSLLWLPFNWSDHGFSVLALNQVYSNKSWSAQDLDFLQAISHQVSIALTKIHLLQEQKTFQEKLQMSASVFTHAREGIIITDPRGNIIDVNASFTRITGYAREEVIGKNPRLLNSGHQNKTFYTNLWRQLIQKGHWYGEVWNQRKNGEVFVEMLTISAVRDAQGKTDHYVALFSDITALKEHEDRLDHIAHYDALTNLPNRVLLADRLKQGMIQELRRCKKLAVVFLDLDGFKAVNDIHGHEAGDQLLVTLSARMKQTLREGDTLARIGGDEFVAVLGDLDDVHACLPMLSRLLSAAALPIEVNDNLLQVSASLGVTFFPQAQDIEADQLMRQADQAMYQAKQSGKNRYTFFDAEQDYGIRSHHESIERIHQGLLNQEFVLHYQPKVNMRTGAIVGSEALIRWQHPENGLLAPALFLPTVENHPLSIEIGEWVINHALMQLSIWQSQGLSLPISVNVGARQLQQTNFVARLHELLAAHPEVNPTNLEIEILETSALEDLTRVSQVIESCRELGVLFAMDDFGTGYSSLTYLRRLRVNLLKIDQSFVRDMLDDADDLNILQGIIGLAKSFRRAAIAEGVETIAHGTLLLQLGCELAQGYGIAKPMPATEVPEWIKNWTPCETWHLQKAIANEDLALLYARVEHRAWVAALGGYLRGERRAPPPMDHHQCNFGQWLDTDGLSRYGALPTLTSIIELHQQVHTLGAEMLDLQNSGRNAQALQLMSQLETLRDKLLEQLEMLVKASYLLTNKDAF